MQETLSDDYPGLRAANIALAVLFCTYVLSFVDRQILALMVGPIREAFGITDFQFSILHGAAFAIMYAIAGLPLGRLADRFSRIGIISGSVVFWSVATCLCGVARSFPQLFVTRMAVGIGEAGFAPAAYSIVADSYRPQHLGYAMAVLKSGVYVGSAVALVLGGVLIDFYTAIGPTRWPIVGIVQPWQATFITVGLPGLALAALIVLLREPSRKGVAVTSDGGTRVTLAATLRFLWRRKRTYLSLFVGSSMLSMAAYGSSAWYPEFFIRTYGVSRAEAGTSYGSLLFVGGLLGIMLGPWVAARLAERHTDHYVRTILYATMAAAVPAIVAPLAGSKIATLVLLFPAIMFGSVYLGIMAASFQPITPNQMRGLTTALYIFLTNIFGLAVGTSVMAAFTDFLYQDDAMLHYSIASANALFYPIAMILFAYGLKGYRASVAEAGNWRIE
jgi:MFS family permease